MEAIRDEGEALQLKAPRLRVNEWGSYWTMSSWIAWVTASVLSLETTANVSEAPSQARSYARCVGGPSGFIWRMAPHWHRQCAHFKDLPKFTQTLKPNSNT